MTRIKYIYFLFVVVSFGVNAAQISLTNAHRGSDYIIYAELEIKSVDSTSTLPVECPNGCYVGVAPVARGMITYPDTIATSASSWPWAFVNGASTLGELEKKMMGVVPRTVNYFSNVSVPVTNVCAALIYFPNPDPRVPNGVGQTWQTGSVAFGKIAPGSNCAYFPLTNTKCSLDLKNINIEHGALSAKEIEGNRKEVSLEITCDGNSDVSLSLNENKPDLGGGVYSDLSLSNSKLNISANGKAGVVLSSIIHTDGNVTFGQHKNNSVVLSADWY